MQLRSPSHARKKCSCRIRNYRSKFLGISETPEPASKKLEPPKSIWPEGKMYVSVLVKSEEELKNLGMDITLQGWSESLLERRIRTSTMALDKSSFLKAVYLEGSPEYFKLVDDGSVPGGVVFRTANKVFRYGLRDKWKDDTYGYTFFANEGDRARYINFSNGLMVFYGALGGSLSGLAASFNPLRNKMVIDQPQRRVIKPVAPAKTTTTQTPYQVHIDPRTGRGPMAIDTSKFTGGEATLRGGVRNPKAFWKEWTKSYGDTLSTENQAAIKAGRSPFVDDTWIKRFPEQAPYKGETLIHHHLDYGPKAIPLPESVHSKQPGWGIWHPEHAGGK